MNLKSIPLLLLLPALMLLLVACGDVPEPTLVPRILLLPTATPDIEATVQARLKEEIAAVTPTPSPTPTALTIATVVTGKERPANSNAYSLEFSVADYGAVPNDGLDDSAAFQEALDQVAKHKMGTVLVPPGVYDYYANKPMCLEGEPDQHIQSAGMIGQQAVIKFHGDITESCPSPINVRRDIMTVSRVYGFVLSGLTFDGYNSIHGDLVFHSASASDQITVKNNTFVNWLSSVAIDHSGAGVAIVKDNYIRNVRAAIWQTNIQGRIIIHGNWIDQHLMTDYLNPLISISNAAIITGNRLISDGLAVRYYAKWSEESGVVITQNWIDGSIVESNPGPEPANALVTDNLCARC